MRLTGKRRSTTYAITPAGRKALREWLRTTPSPPILEAEVLLRTFFAGNGRQEDLVASLTAAREQAVAAQSELAAMAQQSLVQLMRRVLPFVNRIAGGLLVLAGAYVAWYGWFEIRNGRNDATVDRVTDWSFTAGDWLQQNRDAIVLVFALLLLAAGWYAARGRKTSVR